MQLTMLLCVSFSPEATEKMRFGYSEGLDECMFYESYNKNKTKPH